MFFFFNDTATTQIYTLSLHDALPILRISTSPRCGAPRPPAFQRRLPAGTRRIDRKSTRLNSSHSQTSYAVFCLKKNFSETVQNSSRPPHADIRPLASSSRDLHPTPRI